MLGDDIAFGVHEVAWHALFAGGLLDELMVITIWKKADILTVMLVGVEKASFLCNLTNLSLLLLAKMEDGGS